MTTANSQPFPTRADSPGAARRFGLPGCHWSYKYVAILVGIVALLRCNAIVGVYNHTTDELAHIAGSVGLYETGRNLYMVEHPPLQRLVVGLALRLAGAEYPKARESAGVQSRDDANAVGEAIAFRGPVPYWTVLTVARRANLSFAAVLLLYAYLLGRYLASPLAGMLACVFVSFDANFLAHSALVTTDIPAAAGFLAATFHALRFVARPTWRTAIGAGVALGLAMACKFTCVLLAPAVLALIVLRALRHRRGVKGSFLKGLPPFRYFVAIPILAFVALWATYLFNVGHLADQHLFDTEKGWQAVPAWLKRAPLPMPSMPLGFMFMAAIAKSGFPCYFNGHLGYTGHLAYFPEAIAIKSPSGLVCAVALAALAFVCTRRNRRPIILLCLALPPSLLMLTAMTGKLQIGIRHVLPVVPFVYLFAVIHLTRDRWVWPLLGLIAISAVETARVHPDYLPFFNTFAGGSRAGSRYLADSNLDWGQDVARLADYLKQRNTKDYTIKVSGVRVAALVEYLGLDPASRLRDVKDLQQHPHGLLALGVNARLGLEELRKRDGVVHNGPDYTWVRRYPVVKRIGQSIEVYDLDAPSTSR